MNRIVVEISDPGLAEISKMIEQLDSYLGSLYPAESNHLLPVEVLGQPNVTFLAARIDNNLVGCGAFVNQDGEYAEIKRMFVLPEFRGLKVGRRILDELESRAVGFNLKLMRLEVGIFQPEALGLYKKAGYQTREPFGSYTKDPLSIFMEKKLV